MLKIIFLFIAVTYVLVVPVITEIVAVDFSTQRILINVSTFIYVVLFLFSLNYAVFSFILWIKALHKKDSNKVIWGKHLKKALTAIGITIFFYIALTFLINFFTIPYIHPPRPSYEQIP